MTLGEQAAKLYEENEPNGFAPALLRCFLYGVVIKRPDLVVLAEQVFTDGKRIVAVGPNPANNCWWVYFATAPKGETTPFDFMAEAPYPLPYVGYKRRKKIKIHPWDRIRKDIYHGRRT